MSTDANSKTAATNATTPTTTATTLSPEGKELILANLHISGTMSHFLLLTISDVTHSFTYLLHGAESFLRS